jgi:hypothetical protein
MGHLYDKRENAISHPVKAGETLATIAGKYKGNDGVPDDLDWSEIALYNWATKVEDEVTLALCERVGTCVPDPYSAGAKPEGLTLDPKFGPNNPQPILVPKLWKRKALALNKQYTVEARSHTPAPAVNITKLDRWFIPDHETCDVDYRALASGGFDGDVTFEVYASNYGKLKAWKKGLPQFDPLPDVPVYSAAADGGTVADWRGLSKCSEGALSPNGHPLNAAFSPYTAVFRYAKQDAHKEARIDLEPFWVLFDGESKPVAASCEIKWKLHKADLKIGWLQIAAGDGTFVFGKGLSATELNTGNFKWDGKHSNGDLATPEKMPYRVHISAHTDIDTEDALAVAAMQTEVRLYVDQKTFLPAENPYEPITDKISLDFSIADEYPKDAPPPPGDSLWTKYKLAEAGFHPGPIADPLENAHFKTARNEFQRSVPKGGGAGGAPFQRLDIGDDNAETKNALQNLEDRRKRPWFGKPAEPGITIDFNNPGLDPNTLNFAWRPGNWPDPRADDFLARLRDPSKRMIVWVDDRNWYTDGAYWQYGFYNHVETVPLAVLNTIHGDQANLGGDTGDGRGSYEDRDDRVDKDERDIARPWIPLQVDLRLLSKTQTLNDVLAAPPPDVAEKMRKAIGPLRVDWSFDEIEKVSTVLNVIQSNAPVTQPLPELDIESDVLLSRLYHPPAVRGTFPRPVGSRTRMALRWTLDNLKAKHTRKDVTRESLYFNAPVTFGGIRPAGDNPAEYFKAPFGLNGESLQPWTAKPYDARQTICTVIHDDVGQGAENLFKKRVGRAGIYFHPSLMAGDGYQIRAQVRFDDSGPFVSPNAKVHASRYPRLPQAQSVQFRMWRKTTIRGYVSWGQHDDWSARGASCFANLPATGPNEWRAQYTACHVSIENELGIADDQVVQDVVSLFRNLDEYRDIVVSTLKPGDIRAHPTNRNAIVLSDQYFWPWWGNDHYGRIAPSLKPDFTQAHRELTAELLCDAVTLSIRFSLALVKAIERDTGRMRGHVMVQFQTTENCHCRQYACGTCGRKPTFLQNTDLAILHNARCPACGLGTLYRIPPFIGEYTCGRHVFRWEEPTRGGGNYAGSPCPTCHKPLVFQHVDIVDSSLYSWRYQRGSKWVDGFNAPSCGFPVGAFWNVTGDASLWAHEIGHNRHYEHSADAPQKPGARTQHDNALNPTFSPPENAVNAGWDRACLMSYVTQATDSTGTCTYNDERDMPCFCYKCVLRNRGWRVTAVPVPAGDLKDVPGI